MLTATSPLLATSNARSRFTLRGSGLGTTLAVNSAIALVLWWAGVGPLGQQMVYSQAIGLGIWALVHLGNGWLRRPHDPGGFVGGWRLVFLVFTAIALGAVLGTSVGDWYAGRPPLLTLAARPREGWWFLGIAPVVGSAMTLYFYLRGKSSHLQAELERAQRQTAQAQLCLLQSQLEPHMLFNTLATLHALIGTEPTKAQAMLDHLVAYLRSTLVASRASTQADTHTLAQEFERIADYLALMAIRMGPRLQAGLELPRGLRHVPVPPLLLQPLVENAIKHGLEPHVSGGHVSVRAWFSASPHTLHLQVLDTGRGLVGAPTAQAGNGFGLPQVAERLLTAYGPGATLALKPHQPSGTCAHVQIPLTQNLAAP